MSLEYNINMKKIGKLIEVLDQNTSEIKLKFNGVSAYKTKTGGFFSILTFIAIVYVIFHKMEDLLAKNHVYVTEEVSMTDYNSPINI